MARYFLNLRYAPDKLAEDPEGDELNGIEAVRPHVLAAARDLIARTRSHGVRDWFTCRFEITDEDGRPVMTVPFSETVPEEEDDDPVRDVGGAACRGPISG